MSQHSSRGREWEAFRLHILDRDEWTCGYCGCELIDGDNASVEHRIPKVDGGQDTDENCFGSCLPCNQRRGTKAIVRESFFNSKWFTQGWPLARGGQKV